VTLTGRELIARLVDATPSPPPDVGIEQLLAVFGGMLAARGDLLAQAAAPVTLSESDRPLLVELERRQNIWHDALAAALREVGGQRCGAAQLRAYAGPR
jgi:hypothetical protein